MPAFDTRRPPELDVIETCVHCGFCLPDLPHVTPLWNEEMDSPRGRIVLMQEGQEGANVLSDAMAKHWDRCLGCLACVTACPSGVRYDRLIERRAPRSSGTTAAPRARRSAGSSSALPPSPAAPRPGPARRGRRLGPGRLRAAGPAWARLGSHSGSRRVAWFSSPRSCPRMVSREAASGSSRAASRECSSSHVNEATADVLAAEGYEVTAPRRPRCCGALSSTRATRRRRPGEGADRSSSRTVSTSCERGGLRLVHEGLRAPLR